MPIVDGLQRSRNRNPDKVAIAFGGQSWTYAAFDEITDHIAGNLLAAGLEPGDRVVFHLLNGPEIALVGVGCLKAGCIAVPVNPRLKGPEIDYVLRHSGAACYVGQPDLYAETTKSCPAISALDLKYITGDTAVVRTRSLEELFRSAGRPVSLPDVASHQIAAIFYTSGTTTRPKGVTHTHETLTQTADAMRHMLLDENQVAVVMSSMAHLIGFGMLFLSGLLNGATIVITRPFDFDSILESYERRRATYVVGLPVMFRGLLQAQVETPHDVASGRFYFCGGDSVPPALQRAFQPVWGTICEVYGMTEITPLSWNRPGRVRAGSIGQPGEGIEFRLVDTSGAEVKTGEVGEICVRGAQLTTGYWQDPDATAEATRDGWFHTGDLATRDADDYYWFAGRKKDIIIRGGSNISPREVEAALYEHPAVGEAAVVGRPDDVWGEAVVAYVALRPGQMVTEAGLIAFVRERLDDYKTPERIIFQTELPKNPTGKIQRRALRQTAHSMVSQLEPV
ncbi:MAG TPA: AMP-binding protein [Terriglobia bacterium]|nr:AMP-binding protein [Terriglobia bacterium]